MSAADSVPPYAALALALSEQHWTRLGQGDDPLTMATDDLETNVQRVTSLLLVRVMARIMEVVTQAREEELTVQMTTMMDAMILTDEQQQDERRSSSSAVDQDQDHPPPPLSLNLPFPETNWSTSSICYEFLHAQHDWPAVVAMVMETKEQQQQSSSSSSISSIVIVTQVEQFVRSILSKYDNHVPYHNVSHATHVTLSINKLIDMLWTHPRCNTFGLRQNALSLLALVFAAIIHDVEHKGLPNRQLALEDDELALLYNDQSIAEQRSLYVGFKEFLQPDYAELRKALFPSSQDYRDFRTKVVNLVMSTDIASPERTQLAKSKYLEAFGPITNTSTMTMKKKSDKDGQQEAEEHDDEDTLSVAEQQMVEDVGDSVFKSVRSGVKRIGEASIAGLKGSFVKGKGKLVEKVAGVRLSSSTTTTGSAKVLEKTTGSRRRRVSQSRLAAADDGSSALQIEDSEHTESNDNDCDSSPVAVAPANKNGMHSLSAKKNNKPVKKTVKLAINSLGNSLGLRPSRGRLGIRMSMDLTGETVEAFSRNLRRQTLFHSDGETMDEIDELKAAVLMDLMSKWALVVDSSMGCFGLGGQKSSSLV
jgi:hypothetical protein